MSRRSRSKSPSFTVKQLGGEMGSIKVETGLLEREFSIFLPARAAEPTVAEDVNTMRRMMPASQRIARHVMLIEVALGQLPRARHPKHQRVRFRFTQPGVCVCEGTEGRLSMVRLGLDKVLHVAPAHPGLHQSVRSVLAQRFPADRPLGTVLGR